MAGWRLPGPHPPAGKESAHLVSASMYPSEGMSSALDKSDYGVHMHVPEIDNCVYMGRVQEVTDEDRWILTELVSSAPLIISKGNVTARD